MTMEVPFLFLTFIALVTVGYSSVFVSAADGADLKCVPGRHFAYDHNDNCHCNNDGTEITCNREIFSTVYPTFHKRQLQNVSMECEPNKTIKKHCMECVCHENGKFASCVASTCGEGETLGSLDSCLPGTVLADECNGCICGSDGKATCTNLNCTALHLGQSDSILCVPNAYGLFECNECNCTPNGKAMFCNKMGCGVMSMYHEHVLNVTMSCEANTIYDYNCHKCYCDEKGNYAMCSGVPCPREDERAIVEDTVDKCNPGMIFAEECNVCICGQDGKATCTTFSCDLDYGFKYVKY